MKADDLKALFQAYKAVRNPKAPNGLTLDRIAGGTLKESEVLAEYTREVSKSISARADILAKLAQSPASISIRIVDANGQGYDVNGPRLRSAILREDSSILKGKVI